MLLLGLIVVVLTSQGHGSAIRDLGAPLVLVGNAIDIDLSGRILDIKTAILRVEAAHGSGKFEEGFLVSGGDKVSHSLSHSVGMILGLVRFASLTVEGINIRVVGIGLRGIAMIVHKLTADDDLVSDLDVGLAALEFLVAKIHGPEHLELTIGSSILRDEE